MSDEGIKTELEILDCQWGDIKEVVDRAEVLVIGDDLVLRDVALALIADNAAVVKAWLDDGSIEKLSDMADPKNSYALGDKFQLVVVSPFALIKPVD